MSTSKFVLHITCSSKNAQIELDHINRIISNFFKKTKYTGIISYDTIINSTGFKVSYDIGFLNESELNDFKELFITTRTIDYIPNTDNINIITNDMLI